MDPKIPYSNWKFNYIWFFCSFKNESLLNFKHLNIYWNTSGYEQHAILNTN